MIEVPAAVSFSGHEAEHELLSGLQEGALSLKGRDFEFRGQRCLPTQVKGLRVQVEKDLEQDRLWQAAHDRQTFLVHYQMARSLGEAAVRELMGRYAFHLTLQEITKDLLTHQATAQANLDILGEGQELPKTQYREIRDAFKEAHQALSVHLAKAAQLRFPALTNLQAGAPLAPFLLESKLIDAPIGHHIDGEWIGPFLDQLGGVLHKAQRLHFKSLGGLLAFQEKIAQDWTQQVGGVVTAAGATR